MFNSLSYTVHFRPNNQSHDYYAAQFYFILLLFLEDIILHSNLRFSENFRHFFHNHTKVLNIFCERHSKVHKKLDRDLQK